MLAKKWHSLNVWLKKKKIHYNWGKNTIKRLLFTTHSVSLWLVIQNYQLNDLCECKCYVHWQYNLFAISKKCINGWGFSKGSGTCRMLTSILIFFYYYYLILILAFFFSTCLQKIHASVLFLFIRIDIFLHQSRPPLFDKHVTKPSHCTLLANSPTFPAVTDRVVIIS